MAFPWLKRRGRGSKRCARLDPRDGGSSRNARRVFVVVEEREDESESQREPKRVERPRCEEYKKKGEKEGRMGGGGGSRTTYYNTVTRHSGTAAHNWYVRLVHGCPILYIRA